MGSSSTKENQRDTSSSSNSQNKNDANSKFNPPNYNRRATTTQGTYEYRYFVKPSQVNNPYEPKDSYKPFNDLSKSGTNNPSNANLNIPHKNPYSAKCVECNKYPVYYVQKKICINCAKYMAHNRLQELEQKYRDIENKDTVNVQSNLASNVLLNKKEHDPKMQAIFTENTQKPTNIGLIGHTSASLPLVTLTKDNFATMWFSWKNEFLTYIKSVDRAGNNKEKWGIMLLNRLGPSGQEIYRNFIFDDGQAKEDIDVLLEKFDHYCTLQDRTRKNDEDIDTYTNDLKVMASKYTTDVDEIMKKKILEEIDRTKFTNIAKNFIPNFSFSLNIKSLSAQEITYIWMKCENVNFKQKQKIDNDLVRNCDNCSYIHEIGRCPAYGKQCKKCGNMNHYLKRCPTQYKDNCSFCGDSHFYRECPAYMNECSKCHRLHHFYWMCGLMQILNCNFCGLSHIASRHACPAINNICSSCNRAGHFPGKCSNT